MSESTNSATVTDSLTVAADQSAFEAWLRTFPACLTPFAVWRGGRDDLRSTAAASSRTQHDADSKELRRLCAARDAARKEVTELRAQLEEERARNAAPYGTDLEVTAYAMEAGAAGGRITIEQARGRDVVRWAVRDAFGLVLDKSGLMQDEPFPSARTDEWVAEHRFDTAGEAVAAARAWIHALTDGDDS